MDKKKYIEEANKMLEKHIFRIRNFLLVQR